MSSFTNEAPVALDTKVTASEGNAEMNFKGLVTKWPVGSIMGSAKKRFMVIEQGTIAYYETESGYLGGEASLHTYRLNASSVVKRNKEGTIKVEISRGKESILFRSKNETQRWEDCLTNTIEWLLSNSFEDDDDEHDVDKTNLDHETPLTTHHDPTSSSSSSSSEGGTLLGGNIIKKPKSGSFGGAKKRYLVLDTYTGALEYYESISTFENGGHPKGNYQLSATTTIKSVKDKNNDLDLLIKSDSETFTFRAIGQETRWLVALNESVERLHGGRGNQDLVFSIQGETVSSDEVSTCVINTTIDCENHANSGISTLDNIVRGEIRKWPTSSKVGGVKSRYLEIEGDIVSYYTHKGGDLKGSFELTRESQVSIVENKIVITTKDMDNLIFQPAITNPHSDVEKFKFSLQAWYEIVMERIALCKSSNLCFVTNKNNPVAFLALNALASKIQFEDIKNIKLNVLVVTDSEYNDNEKEIDGNNDDSKNDSQTKEYFGNMATTFAEDDYNRVETFVKFSEVRRLDTASLSTRILQMNTLFICLNPQDSDSSRNIKFMTTTEGAGRNAEVNGGTLLLAVNTESLTASSSSLGSLQLSVPTYQDDTWGEYGDFAHSAYGIPIILENNRDMSSFYETGFEGKILYQVLPNMGPTTRDALAQMEVKDWISNLIVHVAKELISKANILITRTDYPVHDGKLPQESTLNESTATDAA